MATYAESVAIRADFLRRLGDLESGAISEMLRAYSVAIERIEQDMLKALEADTPHGRAIAEVFDGAEDTQRIAVIRGRAEAIAEEFSRFGVHGLAAVKSLAPNAYRLGINNADDQIRSLNARFTKPNKRQVEQTVARLQARTAAREYLDGFAITSTQQAVDTMTAGVILGERPDKIARRLRDHVQTTGRARLQTFVHTETLGAARAGIADSFRENADILNGWVWNAEESAQTCEVCWAMNGTEHSLDEDLDSHPNCRCVQSPITKSFEELAGMDEWDAEDIPETGARPFDPDERFNAVLSDAEKIKVLGAGKYALYRDGKIRLADLVTPTFSERWGRGLRATTLRELRDGGVDNGSIIEQVAAGTARAEVAATEAAPTAWRSEFDAAAEAFNRYDLPEGTDAMTTRELFARDGIQSQWVENDAPGLIARTMEERLAEAGRVIDDEIERRVRQELGDDLMDAAREFDAIEREVAVVTRDMSDAWREYSHSSKLYARTPNTRNKNRFEKAEREYRELESRSAELLGRREALAGTARDTVLRAQQNAAREVLGEIRDYGNGRSRVRGSLPDGFADPIAVGERAYPTQWVDNLPDYQWIRRGRGYHEEWSRTIALSGRDHIADVAIHEFGHAMEASIPGMRLLEWVFYYRRTNATKVKARNVPGYSKKEWFREDEFGHFYVGRDYARYYGANERLRPWQSYEIVSMGVEALLGSRRPEVVWRDDDYRRFILGTLALL